MSRKPEQKKAVAEQPRRRRSAEQARREILDAAERRLAEGGPEAVRLQDIARDVGISHPAILHHFGSREGLTQALAQRAIDALDRDLLRALEGPEAGEGVFGLLEQILGALGDSGHARLLAWRALQSTAADTALAEQGMLRHVTDALHRRRVLGMREHGLPEPSWLDSFFAVRLGATALLGDAVAGPLIDLSLDPAEREDLPRRFRAWLVRLIAAHARLATEPHEPDR